MRSFLINKNLFLVPRSKTDNFALIGTRDIAIAREENPLTGIGYLDAKGDIKNDGSGAWSSISMSGKIGGGMWGRICPRFCFCWRLKNHFGEILMSSEVKPPSFIIQGQRQGHPLKEMALPLIPL
jgi:hypothetical protein